MKNAFASHFLNKTHIGCHQCFIVCNVTMFTINIFRLKNDLSFDLRALKKECNSKEFCCFRKKILIFFF